MRHLCCFPSVRRIETGVAGGMNELTAIYDFLALLFNWPTTVDVSFSVSGSMTGDGLPIAVDLTAGGESITLIFCRSSSDCPSSYQCNLGVCSQLASCPPAHPHMYGLLCYSECQVSGPVAAASAARAGPGAVHLFSKPACLVAVWLVHAGGRHLLRAVRLGL
jgi:hypothetical protein